MNPYTGQTTPLDPVLLRDDLFAERERAAAAVDLEDPDDLVLIEGTEELVAEISNAVKAQAKARRRAANKRARKSRKANR